MFSLWHRVSRLLWIFVLKSLMGSSSCSHLDMQPVLLQALSLWLHCMVTSWQTWCSWLVACREHKPPLSLRETSPGRKTGCARRHAAWRPLRRRKLAVCMRLKAGAGFLTSCTQEAAWQMSDFPSGSLLCASQKGTGAVVKYYSLTFRLLADRTGAK